MFLLTARRWEGERGGRALWCWSTLLMYESQRSGLWLRSHWVSSVPPRPLSSQHQIRPNTATHWRSDKGTEILVYSCVGILELTLFHLYSVVFQTFGPSVCKTIQSLYQSFNSLINFKLLFSFILKEALISIFPWKKIYYFSNVQFRWSQESMTVFFPETKRVERWWKMQEICPTVKKKLKGRNRPQN